jgi:tetratricopeptide (TPR) repeat protein
MKLAVGEIGRATFLRSLIRSILAVTCCVLVSCSVPRIIVLSDPLTPEEHLNLGVIYERNGETALAAEEFRKASESLPLAYVYLGNVSFQTRSFDEAEKYYRLAMDKDPSLGDAYNNLAWLYYTKEENLDEAQALAEKAVALNPSQPQYLDTLDKLKALRSGN